jgi:hypothetical protein
VAAQPPASAVPRRIDDIGAFLEQRPAHVKRAFRTSTRNEDL